MGIIAGHNCDSRCDGLVAVSALPDDMLIDIAEDPDADPEVRAVCRDELCDRNAD